MGARLRWAGLFGLIAALSLCLTPGIADAAKKKKDTVKVANYNLYIGSGLADALNAALVPRTDLFADKVGGILNNVNANDFNLRAKKIAKQIKKNKVDVAGLQEAALWRIEVPTDGGGPPRGTSANVVLIDYVDSLLAKLNKKARSKKQCGKAAKKRKAAGKKPKPCYRGYRIVASHQGADVEQPGDFDNNPGPNGKTFDLSDRAAQAALGANAPSRWLDGNDDTPNVNFGEPPPAQCSDGIDNDGDNLIDYGPTAGVNETSGPAFGANPAFGGIQAPSPPPWGCDSRVDNNEAANPPTTDPNGLPQDANFDHHGFAGNFGSADEATPPCPGGPSATCPTGVSYDSVGNGLDAAGITDCPDNSTDPGPPDDGPGGWPFDGVGYDGATVPVCMFHGIDGDLRLTSRDLILARKGAGVKASNQRSGSYSSQLTFNVFGIPISFNRGWVAADMRVRGKKFRLVNTHLENEVGTPASAAVREAQAAELVGPGGAASQPKTVLVGDLNSDPNGGAGSEPGAYSKVTAAGFSPLAVTGPTCCHAEILNNPNDNAFSETIDFILGNSPSIRMRKSFVLNAFANGLWTADHGGIVSSLKVPGKKKKRK